MKFIELKIFPHHLAHMSQTVEKGILNANDPAWLFAFAFYNVENKVRLSMEYDRSYKDVYKFVKHKMNEKAKDKD